MEIQVGIGDGRRRGEHVANAEVLGILQRFEAKMDAMEQRQPTDPEDINEPELEEP